MVRLNKYHNAPFKTHHTLCVGHEWPTPCWTTIQLHCLHGIQHHLKGYGLKGTKQAVLTQLCSRRGR